MPPAGLLEHVENLVQSQQRSIRLRTFRWVAETAVSFLFPKLLFLLLTFRPCPVLDGVAAIGAAVVRASAFVFELRLVVVVARGSVASELNAGRGRLLWLLLLGSFGIMSL